MMNNFCFRYVFSYFVFFSQPAPENSKKEEAGPAPARRRREVGSDESVEMKTEDEVWRKIMTMNECLNKASH